LKASEYKLQVAVVNYLKMQYNDSVYCASLGGQFQPYHSQRVKAKRTGYIAGFPDLFIYEAKGGFHGLAIELKVKGNYATESQKKWITKLNERGYSAKVCTGFDQTKQVIDDYFEEKLQ